VKRLSNSSRHLLRDSRSTRPTAATKSSTSLAIYPVTFSVTTSGTEPHGRVITGVPHANRFDHGQAERLRPIDREQQSQRAPEKFVLLRSVVSLAQLSGVVFSRLFDAFEISAHSSGPAFVRSPRKFQGRLSTE
jgi:hypothetical protein